MKHPPEENFEIIHGCPNTTMRDLGKMELFKGYIQSEGLGNLSLHMNNNAPHFSSKATRIAYNNFLVTYEKFLGELRCAMNQMIDLNNQKQCCSQL